MSVLRTGELTQRVLSHYGTAEGKSDGKYVALTQVRAATGWADPSTADVMIMGNWPSTGAELEGFEVKVSRADWLNEVKAPDKCQPTKKYCDRWWLVIADEIFVREEELPEDWGMMVAVNRGLKVVKKAPKLNPQPLDNLFVASMLRADNREQIPIDLHNEKMKDAVRDAEAAMKAKYQSLRDYVKFLNSGLGIELDWKKSYGYAEYVHHWVASIKKTGHTYDKEELLALIKAALSEDLDDIGYRLYSARDDARKILEIADKALKENGTDWSKR